MPAATTSRTHAPTHGALLVLQSLSSPLALLPSARDQMLEIVARHARGEAGDVAAIEAQLGRPLANEQAPYTVVDGVAVIGVQGTIFPKANLMTQISGGASAQLLERDVRAAGADPSVQSILLSIDSPGGSVLGTPEAASAIRAVAAAKPVVAFSDGLLASAAYWIASAANAIFASGPTVQVGSIGVAATHVDRSAADQEAGIKRTEITAGRYKRIASDTSPLSADGAATMQAQVDTIYSTFVETVADNRGTTVAEVLARMADGRVFIGQQAVDAGLVDGFASLDGLVAAMAANPADFAHRRTARRSGATSNKSTAPTRTAASAGDSTMPRPYTEADAQAYAARTGVRIETARTALGVEPAAATVERTKQEIAAAVVAHAQQRKVSLSAAFGAVTSDEEYADAPNGPGGTKAAAAPPDRQQAADVARTFAARHSVDFLTALKATGGDAATSPADARVLRYAAENRCSRLEALKALRGQA